MILINLIPMLVKFNVEFLPEAVKFLNVLNSKARDKIYFNIRKAQVNNDSELFKKLTDTVWEFRTLYNKTYYRIFAFWDNSDNTNSTVLATHGLIKKTEKTPLADLERAERIRKQYFEH